MYVRVALVGVRKITLQVCCESKSPFANEALTLGRRRLFPEVHMQEQLEEAIIKKAKAILREHRIAASTKKKNAARYTKRTGLKAGDPIIIAPRWWDYHPHFDPRYCIRHAKFLSRTICRKLQQENYKPIPAVQFDIPKPDGSSREIMAFSVPDAALANILHRAITARNINLFSSHSYAYRPDKNVFDALLHIKRSLNHPKSYVIQYDFKKYFDSIDHGYLRRILKNKELFLLTSAERVVIEAFLEHEYAHVNNYQKKDFLNRTAGVPQGCSLSLFLSNAAAHELDLALERQNGTFARFADDVVAIAYSYTDAKNIAFQFRTHCKLADLKINYEKSPGILLYDNGIERDKRTFFVDHDDGSHLDVIDNFSYLGHKIHANGISLSDKAVRKIKRRITEIIYKHLLLHRRKTADTINTSRVGAGFGDWDLVTCVNEIRGYLYGGLRESQIESFIANESPLPFVKGLLAFYPLITDSTKLIELDGWLKNALGRALRERNRVLALHGIIQKKIPGDELISGSWYTYAEIKNDTRLPSFVRGWRAARKYYLRYGLKNIDAPSYYSMMAHY